MLLSDAVTFRSAKKLFGEPRIKFVCGTLPAVFYLDIMIGHSKVNCCGDLPMPVSFLKSKLRLVWIYRSLAHAGVLLIVDAWLST